MCLLLLWTLLEILMTSRSQHKCRFLPRGLASCFQMELADSAPALLPKAGNSATRTLPTGMWMS